MLLLCRNLEQSGQTWLSRWDSNRGWKWSRPWRIPPNGTWWVWSSLDLPPAPSPGCCQPLHHWSVEDGVRDFTHVASGGRGLKKSLSLFFSLYRYGPLWQKLPLPLMSLKNFMLFSRWVSKSSHARRRVHGKNRVLDFSVWLLRDSFCLHMHTLEGKAENMKWNYLQEKLTCSCFCNYL